MTLLILDILELIREGHIAIKTSSGGSRVPAQPVAAADPRLRDRHAKLAGRVVLLEFGISRCCSSYLFIFSFSLLAVPCHAPAR